MVTDGAVAVHGIPASNSIVALIFALHHGNGHLVTDESLSHYAARSEIDLQNYRRIINSISQLDCCRPFDQSNITAQGIQLIHHWLDVILEISLYDCIFIWPFILHQILLMISMYSFCAAATAVTAIYPVR